MSVSGFVQNLYTIGNGRFLNRYARSARTVNVANAPPIDVFPAYDEQPGPRADDYIADPDYPADLSRRSSTCWVVAESEA